MLDRMNRKDNLPAGFIPVMITPFHEDGSIDYGTLQHLVDFYISAGSAGLFANCLSSEMFELSEKERLELVEHVIRFTDGRVPVVATGSFGDSLVEMADFSKKIYDLGVDAVILLSNVFATQDESEEQFFERFEQFCVLTPGIPLGLYECPVPYKRILSPDLLAKVVRTGRLVYHKDTCLNLSEIQAKLKNVGDVRFGLYDAYMPHARESLEAGARGLSCIQGNYFPELIVRFCDWVASGAHPEKVEQLQQFFTKHMELMHQAYPIAAKYVLQKSGLQISLTTRRLVGELSENQKIELDNLWNEAQQLLEQMIER